MAKLLARLDILHRLIDGFLSDANGLRRNADAAVFFREWNSKHSHFGHLRDSFCRESLISVDLCSQGLHGSLSKLT